MTRFIWMLCGGVALVLGVVGIFLPLMPTVPLLLMAAFCFARSSQALHDWLLDHPKLGPPIHDWRRNGAIGRKAKILATLSIGLSFALSFILGLTEWLLLVQVIVLSAVALFIWTRPEE